MNIKRFLFFAALFSSLFTFQLNAKAPNKFTNLGFAFTNMKQANSKSFHSDLGFSLNKATTYYLHKPIAGKLLFGIDVAWTDITYSNYKVNYIKLSAPDETETSTIHALDITVQGGLGINYAITNNVNLHAFARYAPGVAGIFQDNDLMAGFLNSADFGLLINWKFIGVGFDWRFGQSRHKSVLPQIDLEDASIEYSKEKIKTNISGGRVFLSLSF